LKNGGKKNINPELSADLQLYPIQVKNKNKIPTQKSTVDIVHYTDKCRHPLGNGQCVTNMYLGRYATCNAQRTQWTSVGIGGHGTALAESRSTLTEMGVPALEY
jgi:hypothetical protein